MNIDEAIEKLTARINCQQADLQDACTHKCDDCPLQYLRGNYGEAMEVDRFALAALLTLQKWKKVEIV